MTEDDLPALPVCEPAVEWDGRVSVPCRWPTGEFGTLRLPADDWRDTTKKHWVGDDMQCWMGFNGLYWAPCESPHRLPVPVVYPDGREGPVVLSWWWPGDPYPPFWQHGARYVYDEYRGVYVRSGAEHRPAKGGLATAGGAWFALAFFGCLAGPAGGGVGFLLGLVIFLITCVCMAVKGASNIANPPTRENVYAKRKR